MKRVRPIGWPTGHHCQRSSAIVWRVLSSNLHRLQMAKSSDCWCNHDLCTVSYRYPLETWADWRHY
uniref:Uncharacterized protein n=1 Tax=Arundo donax TaxID=35708 RepID=A0A0A9GH43_ARUDO